MEKRIDVYKKTDDDWYPNHHKRLVEVSYVWPELTDGTVRVCVWGADDCGMNKDFQTKEEAYAVFEYIISWDAVNKEALKEIGFEYF